MANWQEPTNTSPYSTVLDLIRAMAADAATLFVSTPTNHPLNSIRWNRTTKIFEEWNGTTWVAQVIGIPGGGTGAALPGDIAASLGLGTMSIQNANAVAITGGSIANLTSSGTFYHTGTASRFTISQGNGFEMYGTGTATWTASVISIVSGGMIIQAGATRAQYSLLIGNNPTDKWGLKVTGDQVVRCDWRLVIPVGTDYWVTP